MGQKKTPEMASGEVEVPLADFFQVRDVKDLGRTALVAVHKMNRTQARVAYPYRPISGRIESRYGGSKSCRDAELLSGHRAKRCRMCAAPTKKEFLSSGSKGKGICPDCDGRAECMGVNPHLPPA